LSQQPIEHLALVRLCRCLVCVLWKMGSDHPQARFDLADVQVCPFPSLLERLLNKENTPLASAPAQQVLRALVDEVPAQMRQTDEIVGKRAVCAFPR
jgi:hypothetical protein